MGIAICGFGEIATKAHLPAILKASGQYRVVAIIDPNREMAVTRLGHFGLSEKDVAVYQGLAECLGDFNSKKSSKRTTLDAVAVCTPSLVTLDLAAEALQAGKHVLVEKPPGDWRRLFGLQSVAQNQRIAFFTAYHTAACVGLPHAKEWLTARANSLEKIQVTWKECVRKWHPGQEWVTRKNPAGNVCEGVLDIVFNPLSLLFALLGPMQFRASTLVVPSNWETPISGSFALTANTNTGNIPIPVNGEFGWDYERAASDGEGPDEIWTIDFHGQSSVLSLQEGGCQVYRDGQRVTTQSTAAYPLGPEYQNLYKQFSTLVANRSCAVDDTTPRLLQEIQDKATRGTCQAYNM